MKLSLFPRIFQYREIKVFFVFSREDIVKQEFKILKVEEV